MCSGIIVSVYDANDGEDDENDNSIACSNEAAATAHSTRDLSDVECRHKNRVKSLDIGSAGAARVPFYARIHRFRLFFSPFFFCYFHYGFSCRARLPCLSVRVH